MSTDVFVISLFENETDPKPERFVARVGAVAWPFAQRLWRQHRGSAEMPADLRPFLLLRPKQTGSFKEPPPPGGRANGGPFSLSPLKEPYYTMVEVTLDTTDEIISHGFYRLEDVFDEPLTTLAEMLANRGELRLRPGKYRYDVQLGSYRTRRASSLHEQTKAFSEGSFDLPLLDDNEPMLDFERLEDAPLAPAAPKRARFEVPGRHRIGLTRFGEKAWENLACQLPIPLDREIGGYLVGKVGEGENGEETVTIHQAVPAELSVGDAHTLLMSPESGAEIRRRIASEWPDDELVGWYHTHVFSARNDVLSGLSSIDEKTHDEQFTRSWQLAVLINTWRDGGTVSRQIRVFRRNAEHKLVETDYSVVLEGGRP